MNLIVDKGICVRYHRCMNKLIEEKIKEIENYKRILDNYYGRWNDYGKRHLQELEEELKTLEENAVVAQR